MQAPNLWLHHCAKNRVRIQHEECAADEGGVGGVEVRLNDLGLARTEAKAS